MFENLVFAVSEIQTILLATLALSFCGALLFGFL
jgi:hypothetical protein